MKSFCSSKTIEKPKIIKTKARKNVILGTPQRVRLPFREFE